MSALASFSVETKRVLWTRREVLEQRDLVDGLHLEQRLLDAVARARDDVQHRLLMLGRDELLGHQAFEQLVLPDASHGQGWSSLATRAPGQSDGGADRPAERAARHR